MALLLEESPKANSYIEADYMLREAYYKTVKAINPTLKKKGPYGADELYDTFKGIDKEWSRNLNKYLNANVKDHVGYTFDEYMQLPIGRAMTLIESLMDKNVIKNKADRDALAEMNKLMK